MMVSNAPRSSDSIARGKSGARVTEVAARAGQSLQERGVRVLAEDSGAQAIRQEVDEREELCLRVEPEQFREHALAAAPLVEPVVHDGNLARVWVGLPGKVPAAWASFAAAAQGGSASGRAFGAHLRTLPSEGAMIAPAIARAVAAAHACHVNCAARAMPRSRIAVRRCSSRSTLSMTAAMSWIEAGSQ